MSLFALMAILFINAKKTDVYFNEHTGSEFSITE